MYDMSLAVRQSYAKHCEQVRSRIIVITCKFFHVGVDAGKDATPHKHQPFVNFSLLK